MQGGFSFCGVDVATLGIVYAPDMSGTYVYGQTWQPQVQNFEGFNGALYCGETVQPKEFRLRCYFEDSNVNDGVIDRVLDLFARGRTGRLVFNQRPWVWYTATAVAVDLSQFRNYRNGFLNITLRAYYPFARSDKMTLDDFQEAEQTETLLNTTNFVPQDAMPPTSYNTITSSKVIHLLNPGNDYAALSIAVAGEAGDGVLITNTTTGQECKLIAFTKQLTTQQNAEVICDSLNGKTIIGTNQNASLGFVYHDHGFLTLKPSGSVIRNIDVELDGNTITSESVSSSWVNRFACVHGQWYKITSALEGNAVLDDDGELQGQEDTQIYIADINELVVQPLANCELDSLRFSYKPTFR